MTGGDRTDPVSYYDDYGEREWERLDRDFFHRLEWEGTIEQLDRELPAVEEPADPARILDVGGGAGRYSVWLAERGYDVTLVDPSETQREIAREKCSDHDVDEQVTIDGGDVRNLAFETDAFDATCCLGGPLSHVLDAAERRRAAEELRRVTTPGNPVFVSVMGLLGAIMITVQYAGRVEEALDDLVIMPDLAREGDYTEELVARYGLEQVLFDCHFFRRGELLTLLEGAGLVVDRVVALEGIAGSRRDHLEALDGDDRDAIRELNDLFRTDPAVVDVSPHMLAICRA